MAGRWRDPSAFRADPAAAPAARPTHRQTIALLAVLVLVAGAVAIASVLVRPERARAFSLLHGSLFLADEQSPVAVDLASGKPTLRLVGADKQVGVSATQKLGVVPLEGRTLLLNQTTGEFNMVDTSGFLVKHDGGVPLGGPGTGSSAMGVADGELAYVVRSNSTGTDVYLVSQATVESATSATGKVKPRASTVLAGERPTADPGAAVAADGALWLLVQTPTGQTVRQLSVPSGSSTGAALLTADRGTVSGHAALGAATLSSGGSGTSVVGLASADRIRIYNGGRDPQTVPFRAVPGLLEVLPASSAAGRLTFLLRSPNGWSVVSVGADGSDLRGPNPITGIPRDADLAEPAASGGLLYTIDKHSIAGDIYQIDDRGAAKAVAGRATYPVVTNVESATFADAYVVARGPRVVVNSPTHINAVMLFTDGSRSPRTIQKSSAVAVSAATGADQLTRSTVTGPQPGQNPKPGTAPKPVPGQAINNKIDCKSTAQKPHIPTIDRATPGSRSVLLHWTYPILDPTQDCFPTTYVLSVTRLSADAPDPPSSVTIQGQDGANLTGLYPNTRYEITVTAYIHNEGTSSSPVPIKTGPEGPAAPTAVSVSADSAGNWNLSWQGCGTVAQGCVAAQSWTVTPSFCDGRGLGEPPAPMTVTADPTSKAQPPAVYKGGDALLGRGLSFTITGQGDSQVPGTPSAKTACTYSWSPALPGAMQLSASQPANTSLGGSTSTNVTLNLGANPTRDVGGVGAQITLILSGPNGTQSKAVTYDGRQTTLSANFGGVQAGAQYTASATVKPAHGGTLVTIPSVPVTTRADWPDVGLNPTCPSTGLLSCELKLTFTNLASSQANGEKFDFDGTLRCNGAGGQAVTLSHFDPGTPDLDGGSVATLLNNGTCSVAGDLTESTDSPHPEVFGGTTKHVESAVDLGSAPRSGAGQGDFDVAWVDGTTTIKIHYKGGQDLNALSENWSETVTPPGGSSPCASANDMPDTTITVSPDCVNSHPGNGWTVQISYQDKTDGKGHGPFSYTLAAPSGFAYCTPTQGDFSAAWSQTAPATVTVTVKDSAQIAGCSNWNYTLTDPNNAECPTTGGTGPPPATLTPTCSTAPPATGWQVQISWDAPGNPQPVTVQVDGQPPS